MFTDSQNKNSRFFAVSILACELLSTSAVAATAAHRIQPGNHAELPFRFSEDLKGKIFEPWQLSPSLGTLPVPAEHPPGWVDPIPHEYSPSGPIGDVYGLLGKLGKTKPAVVFDQWSPTQTVKLPAFDLSKVPKIPAIAEVIEPAKVLTPFITGAFDIEDRVAVFKTSDEHLYYVVPNRWKISMNGVTVDTPKDPTKSTRMRFLLSPSYTWANELTNQIRSEDPLAFFVPIPKRFKDFKLEVPYALGKIENQLLPTDTMTIGEQIYMSVELGAEQIEILKILNEANTYLTGSVSFEYPYDAKTNFLLISEIWLDFEKI
ncbi:MAG: hypothetical protein EOP07_18870 [Proteobacteria bacterium]|nr:MAG: hypothetical protein EOP07_18870 [Pseudomonadota bacterium]